MFRTDHCAATTCGVEQQGLEREAWRKRGLERERNSSAMTSPPSHYLKSDRLRERERDRSRERDEGKTDSVFPSSFSLSLSLKRSDIKKRDEVILKDGKDDKLSSKGFQ